MAVSKPAHFPKFILKQMNKTTAPFSTTDA